MIKFYNNISDTDQESQNVYVIFTTTKLDYCKTNKNLFKIPLLRIKDNIYYSDREDELSYIKRELTKLHKISKNKDIFIPVDYKKELLINSINIQLLIEHFYTYALKENNMIGKDVSSLRDITQSSQFKKAIELLNSSRMKIKTKLDIVRFSQQIHQS